MISPFSRRSLFRGAGGLAGAAALSKVSPALAQSAPEKPALMVVFLNGGFNSLFGSADSFLGQGSFGVTTATCRELGNGLVVDAPTYGTMPAFALSHLASVGVRHGLTAHEAAQPALAGSNGRSHLNLLARALGGDAAIKSCVVGGGMPAGPAPAEGDVSLQGITDMKATIVALGGDLDPSVPNREIATQALLGSTSMSRQRLLRSPSSLRSVKEGLDTGVETLRRQGLALDYAGLCQAYGVQVGTTGVSNFKTQMMAAELMVQAGANVIYADDGGWDTHGDTDGTTVRNQMRDRILPGLNVFLSRMLPAQGRNVVVALCGDFARSLPGSDHQGNLTATVIGKYVRTGTTGKVNDNVALPAGTPGVQELWAYLAAVTRSPEALFGPNPHTAITL